MRKSRELRLSQTKELMQSYYLAGLESDRSYRFMSDMLHRLEREKSLSKGQRNYLDSIIDLGVPIPKNEARVKEILDASEVDGMQEVSNTLKDFAHKVGKGWHLSEKQEVFLSKLLAKSEKMKSEGRFRPSPDAVKDLESAVDICKTKNSWYWSHRPGTAKAYDKVSDWLDWLHTKEPHAEILKLIPDHVTQIMPEPIIDQWVCDKILDAAKNPINELKDPKHKEGSMAWKFNELALITGLPILEVGIVVYPCLVNGEDITVRSEDLKKRRRK